MNDVGIIIHIILLHNITRDKQLLSILLLSSTQLLLAQWQLRQHQETMYPYHHLHHLFLPPQSHLHHHLSLPTCIITNILVIMNIYEVVPSKNNHHQHHPQVQVISHLQSVIQKNDVAIFPNLLQLYYATGSPNTKHILIPLKKKRLLWLSKPTWQ